MEEYPLIIDGEARGTLRVRREGGWTVFDARCAAAEGVVRISVYGGRTEGYLGVLAPEDGALTLHRRLSRLAMRDFPAQIEYAGRAGLPPPEEAGPAPEPQEGPAPPPEAEEARAAPEPEIMQEKPPAEEELYWYATPDGALVAFDGECNLVALPTGDPRLPDAGGTPRRIDGRDYLVFRAKDGRLLR